MANLKVAYCGGKWVENGDTIEWSSPKKNNVSNITSNWDTALSGGIKNETDADAFIFAETEGENRLVELHVFKSACPTKMTCEYTTNPGQIIYNNTNIWRKELYNSNGILVNTVMADYDSFSSTTSTHNDLRIGTYSFYSYRDFASPRKVKFSFININDDIPSATNENMFSGITSLKSCDIPWQMKNISTKTFYGCTGLTDYSNAEWIETIGESAFTNCTRLQTIKIGWPTSISPCSFYGCSNATTIDWCNLPSGKKSKMTKIPNSAFTNCTNLQYSKFSDGQTSEFTIPNGITEIGEYAFYNCTSLTNINLNQATKIGKHAFDSVGGEQEVTYDGDLADLTSIGDNAFANVHFTSGVTINCGVGASAFTHAVINGDSKFSLWNNTIKTKAFYGAKIGGNIKIEGLNGIISADAFNEATITRNLEISQSISLSSHSFNTVSISGSATIGQSVPSQAFIDAKIGGSLTVSGSVGTSAFEGVQISGDVTVYGDVGEKAFSGETIGGNITVIGGDITVSGDVGTSAFTNAQISGDVTVYGDVNEKAFYGATIGGNIMVSGSAGTSSFESAIIRGNIITVSGSVGTSAFTNATFETNANITVATNNDGTTGDTIYSYAFANVNAPSSNLYTNAETLEKDVFSDVGWLDNYHFMMGNFVQTFVEGPFPDGASFYFWLDGFTYQEPIPSWVCAYINCGDLRNCTIFSHDGAELMSC